MPLEFTFRGSFFDLADLFHRMKRFVRVKGERVAVHGRLMTIDGITLNATDFPRLKAEVNATVYLAPKNEGATAGASPSGPAPAAPAGGSAPATSSPAPSAAPTATAASR